jgi:DNA-binding NarL/FixJ family response regulator
METVASRPAEGARAAGKIRVLIADKSAHYRETLRRVLDQFGVCSIVGEAGTLHEAVSLALAADPDVALLDFDLVVKQSAARLRRLAQAFPRLQVIVLLAEYSEEYRKAVKERWGYWCVAKDRVEEQLAFLIAGARAGVTRASAS